MSTPPPLVLDASVLTKLFVQEADTASARALVGTGRAMAAPELAAVEVASAVIRKFRVGSVSKSDAEQFLTKVRGFFLSGAVALTPDAQLQPRAEAIALDIKHALADCLYVALAERFGAEFVTADATLLARASPRFPFVRAL